MKKRTPRKLSLSRETLRGLDDLKSEDLVQARGGTDTQTTCFQTCHCKSGYSCDWSICGC